MTASSKRAALLLGAVALAAIGGVVIAARDRIELEWRFGELVDAFEPLDMALVPIARQAGERRFADAAISMAQHPDGFSFLLSKVLAENGARGTAAALAITTRFTNFAREREKICPVLSERRGGLEMTILERRGWNRRLVEELVSLVHECESEHF